MGSTGLEPATGAPVEVPVQKPRKRCERNREGIIMADLQTTRPRSISTGLGANRAIVWIFLAADLPWCVGAIAATGADLYRAKVTVTGQGEANRIIGFAACLEDVLIKASGAQKLSGERRLAA